MDELAKEYVISYFDRALGFHGDRPEAVMWSASGQANHYRCMLDIGPLEGRKLLDFGCGKGDFYGFLKDNGISTAYTGCDINPRFINLASGKYPDARSMVFDIDHDRLKEEYDYIFLCGVFNLRVSGLDETVRETLFKLFPYCRRGLGFNGLSSLDPKKDPELNYIGPGELVRFIVKNLSPYVSLRHDRMPYDFTVFVYSGLPV